MGCDDYDHPSEIDSHEESVLLFSENGKIWGESTQKIGAKIVEPFDSIALSANCEGKGVRLLDQKKYELVLHHSIWDSL